MLATMPDWFYRTVAQRVLFALPDETGRAVALGVIGGLGKSACGRALIEFMGHMAPDPRLEVRIGGTAFCSPVGLGWRIDPELRATRGLAGFGAGCIEVREGARQAVARERGGLSDGVSFERPGRADASLPLPVLRRFVDDDGHEKVRLPSGAELRVKAWDSGSTDEAGNFSAGVVLQVGDALADRKWKVPAPMPPGLIDAVRATRKRLNAGAPLIVSGGVSQPRDAVALIEAGADLILIDAGLIYTGPSLVKRCNEALSQRLPDAAPVNRATSLFRRSWFWAAALGAALFVGGGATLALAASRVLLPYDESYLGLTSAALRRNLPNVFAFMAHDRGTLAGTMLGLGWLYALLAWQGVRRGRHGTRTAIIASALVGFASFFAFFGFGYFDTLHAFVAVALFQLTVQVMVGEEGDGPPPPEMADEEDARWRRAQWAQLLWVVHAAGLLIAGGVITFIGMTSVFVSEDLGFLCFTAQEAQALGEKMIGVIAHDRASLGGMLLASGVAMLLPVLWCFRRGGRWLWWAIAGLGIPAYGASLGMHWAVGYTDWRHIVPALAGLLLWAGGLLLSRGYLCEKAEQA